MTDLSREELRAHLSAVEAQVRAALRIVAAESKSVQQAHSALRADLSAALIRLQADLNDGNKRVGGKIEKAISEIDSLSRQRRMTAAVLTTMVLLFGITLGLFAGGGWYLLSRDGGMNFSIPGLSTQSGSGPASTGTSITLPQNTGANTGTANSGAELDSGLDSSSGDSSGGSSSRRVITAQ